MKINTLKMQSHDDTRIDIWCECHSPEDIDALVAWLMLAKHVMEQWRKITKSE